MLAVISRVFFLFSYAGNLAGPARFPVPDLSAVFRAGPPSKNTLERQAAILK